MKNKLTIVYLGTLVMVGGFFVTGANVWGHDFSHYALGAFMGIMAALIVLLQWQAERMKKFSDHFYEDYEKMISAARDKEKKESENLKKLMDNAVGDLYLFTKNLKDPIMIINAMREKGYDDGIINAAYTKMSELNINFDEEEPKEKTVVLPADAKEKDDKSIKFQCKKCGSEFESSDYGLRTIGKYQYYATKCDKCKKEVTTRV